MISYSLPSFLFTHLFLLHRLLCIPPASTPFFYRLHSVVVLSNIVPEASFTLEWKTRAAGSRKSKPITKLNLGIGSCRLLVVCYWQTSLNDACCCYPRLHVCCSRTWCRWTSSLPHNDEHRQMDQGCCPRQSSVYQSPCFSRYSLEGSTPFTGRTNLFKS